jgi:hypothetical protein
MIIWRRVLCLLIFAVVFLPSISSAAITLVIKDKPNDNGTALIIYWQIPGFILPARDSTYHYLLQEAISGSGNYQDIDTIKAAKGEKTRSGLDDKKAYDYRIKISGSSGESYSSTFGPYSPEQNWFHTGRINVLIGVLITGLLVGGFILYGKRGNNLYIRPITGLQAVDEAIGRATEMGKPILYSAGRGTMTRPATIASMNILGTVARRVAEYNTPLLFPNNDPVVMAVAQEVMREGYSQAGHPENFNPDNVFFVTDSQFGYAAAVDGIMLREKPATNLFFGTFEAESLILAETGNSVGAIQIAGTDSSIQMAFFIVACDYVIIGEELFAASGYLSQDPRILGSLKGSDYAKLLIIVVLIIGVILALSHSRIMLDWLTIT